MSVNSEIVLYSALNGIVRITLNRPDKKNALNDAMIAALKDKLNLNTSQQQQWDSIVAQAQAARQAAHAAFDQLKAATQAELAKAEPDLASLAAQADAALAAGDLETFGRLYRQLKELLGRGKLAPTPDRR